MRGLLGNCNEFFRVRSKDLSGAGPCTRLARMGRPAPTARRGTATAARARASAKPAVLIGMLRSVHNGLVLEAASEAAGSKKGRG